jgi:BirA family biotin operon repressor/biotin-[acetyl-CoA-carboxylase] ligase
VKESCASKKGNLWGILWERSPEFVPWGELAQLGWSRKDLGEALRVLEAHGYRLDNSPLLGLRLSLPLPETLCPWEWEHRLARLEIPWFKGECYQWVESTNQTLYLAAEKGAPEGSFVLAEGQTQGRGRWGRQWYSQPGLGLYGSILLRPWWPASAVARLGILASLAAAEALEELTGRTVELLWPNDLLLCGKKLGGVLVESCVVSPRIQFAVVGLGINLYQREGDWPDSLKDRATSLALHTATAPRRVELWVAFLKRLFQLYQSDFFSYQRLWEKRSSLRDTPVLLTTSEGSWVGRALGLDEDGNLWVEDEKGRARSLSPSNVLKVEGLDLPGSRVYG